MVIVRNEETFSYPKTYMVPKERTLLCLQDIDSY